MPNAKLLCRCCKERFSREAMININGGWFKDIDHATRYAQKKAAQRLMKKLHKENRERKLKSKTRGQSLREAQTAFNAYIRERDKEEPCISCQRHHKGQYHAGHYRTVGAAGHLRFNEHNCNKQCSACNNYLSGNLIQYRVNLIKKIGLENVVYLENNNDSVKWSVDFIDEVKALYKRKLKQLRS